MLPLETSFLTKNGSKYKENGNIFVSQLISAITFYRKMRFWNRFHWWSAFFILFKMIPILAIIIALIWPFRWWPLWQKLKNGHNCRYGYDHIIVKTMVNIGIVLKSTKNADHQWKRFQKRINLSKDMAKTSHRQKLWPFPLYSEPISGQKYGFQRQHFPCELRADLYVFGIRVTRRMGAAS